MLIGAFALVTTACGSSDDTTTTGAPIAIITPTTAEEATTTTAAETTTSEAEVTTTAGGEETTTTELVAAVVAPTTAIGSLEPYGPGEGGHMFPPGSVEAHWYQWNGSYVVLYRGFDATAGQEICAGNSILEDLGFNHVTNSPYLNDADVICIDAAEILEPPDGVQACGPLLYYLTAIPVDTSGTLYGTMEIGFGDGRWEGQTSTTPSDASVPQFEPGLAAYELPASGVDDLGVIACGA